MIRDPNNEKEMYQYHPLKDITMGHLGPIPCTSSSCSSSVIKCNNRRPMGKCRATRGKQDKNGGTNT
eukprot:m.199273 g.199273  ORF g.199273 m.199273 type:complete len:67 (+) comp15724_c0_seq1:342-542(+)